MIISRDFPVERLVGRALPQIPSLWFATVMLRRGNGGRKVTAVHRSAALATAPSGKPPPAPWTSVVPWPCGAGVLRAA